MWSGATAWARTHRAGGLRLWGANPERRVREHTVGMTVAVIGRWAAAVAGGLLVLTAWASLVATLIVARPVGNRLTHWVDRLVNGAFRLATSRIADYRHRDRILAEPSPVSCRA